MRRAVQRFRLPCLALLAWMHGQVTPPVAVADPTDPRGQLWFATWEAAAWGEALSGSACWLLGGDLQVRLEIRAGRTSGADRWAALLDRIGEGWTLAAIEPGSGTLNRWGEEWRPVEPELVRAVRLIAVLAASGPEAASSAVGIGSRLLPDRRARLDRPRWFREREGGRGAETRIETSTASPGPTPATGSGDRSAVESAFRAALTDRGRGRGGRSEILTFLWPEPAREDLALVITSSRRPGRLALSATAIRPVRYPDPESFLPLWPLRQMVSFEAEGGTP